MPLVKSVRVTSTESNDNFLVIFYSGLCQLCKEIEDDLADTEDSCDSCLKEEIKTAHASK